jgi:hypothetical protein
VSIGWFRARLRAVKPQVGRSLHARQRSETLFQVEMYVERTNSLRGGCGHRGHAEKSMQPCLVAPAPLNLAYPLGRITSPLPWRYAAPRPPVCGWQDEPCSLSRLDRRLLRRALLN